MTTTTSRRQEQRAFPRWLIGEAAALRTATGTHACRIVDISAGGVRAETAACLAIEDSAQIMLSGLLPLEVRVVRAEPGAIAAAFTGGPHYLFR